MSNEKSTTESGFKCDVSLFLEGVNNANLAKNSVRSTISLANTMLDIEGMKEVIECLDNCNIELSSRSDDNAESFKTRFNIYLNNVKDVLDYYDEKKVLYIVKSCESKEDTFNSIEKILKEMNI